MNRLKNRGGLKGVSCDPKRNPAGGNHLPKRIMGPCSDSKHNRVSKDILRLVFEFYPDAIGRPSIARINCIKSSFFNNWSSMQKLNTAVTPDISTCRSRLGLPVAEILSTREMLLPTEAVRQDNLLIHGVWNSLIR
jgi:hypothetical protein